MKLTDARRRGIESLARVYPEPGRESNQTDVRIGYVYWQTVTWLVRERLATTRYLTSRGGTYVDLTSAGVELAREIGVLS